MRSSARNKRRVWSDRSSSSPRPARTVCRHRRSTSTAGAVRCDRPGIPSHAPAGARRFLEDMTHGGKGHHRRAAQRDVGAGRDSAPLLARRTGGRTAGAAVARFLVDRLFLARRSDSVGAGWVQRARTRHARIRRQRQARRHEGLRRARPRRRVQGACRRGRLRGGTTAHRRGTRHGRALRLALGRASSE